MQGGGGMSTEKAGNIGKKLEPYSITLLRRRLASLKLLEKRSKTTLAMISKTKSFVGKSVLIDRMIFQRNIIENTIWDIEYDIILLKKEAQS
jgi:hypothetical protein